jgi:hypothetical protein
MADNDQDQPPPPRPAPWFLNQPNDDPSYRPPQRNSALHDTFVPMASGAAAVAQAGTSSPTPSANLSGAAAVARAGEIRGEVKSSITVETDVIRAPFSEAGIAERLVADPEFYRRLASFAATELRAYAADIDTSDQGNANVVIKGRVTEIADGFDETASALTTQNGILTPEAAAKAAVIVSKVRAAYAALCSDHPDLLKIAKICVGGMALYHFGHVPAEWAGLISYAVIGNEKLSDFIGGKKKDE